MVTLRTLDYGDNFVNATIPDTFGQLVNLEELIGSMNFQFGEIPTTIGQALKLTNLDLSENVLVGGLPTEIGALTSLGKLGRARLVSNYDSERSCSNLVWSFLFLNPSSVLECGQEQVFLPTVDRDWQFAGS